MRDALRGLLERYRYWPHAPRSATPAQVASYALTTIPEAAAITIAGGAAAALYETPWDTRKLGVRAGRLVLVAPDGGGAPVLEAALAGARRDGFGYVITRVDANDLHAVQALEASGFQVVDAILSQYLTVGAAPPQSAVPVRVVEPGDADALAEIADLSFDQSRFHNDPFVGATRARAFYRAWAADLARGLNTLTLVALHADRVAGFLSCLDFAGARPAYGWGYGRIELVAVHPAARGAGLVQAMTARLIADAPRHDWRLLGIGTQIGNIRAMRAYASAGFRPGDAIFTLRWLNP